MLVVVLKIDGCIILNFASNSLIGIVHKAQHILPILVKLFTYQSQCSVMKCVLYRELIFDTQTLAQLADGAATVKVYMQANAFIISFYHLIYL